MLPNNPINNELEVESWQLHKGEQMYLLLSYVSLDLILSSAILLINNGLVFREERIYLGISIVYKSC
jgi:hypothetical protein